MNNQSQGETEKKARWIALAVTVAAAVVAICILLFCGLYRPFPPPPEYGVEVSLGYSEAGAGEVQAFEPESSPMQENQVEEVASEPEEEVVLETSEEEAPALARKDPETPKPEPTKSPKETEQVERKEPEQPELNPLALYPGKRKGQEPSTQGKTTQAGDQGKPEGDFHAQGYEGSGGSGGISFTLNGRTLMSLAKPPYDSEEEGVVVVRIWVDRNGVVVRTQAGVKGTTTMDRRLWTTAEDAARKSRFVPSEHAPEPQVGTITYRFVRGM